MFSQGDQRRVRKGFLSAEGSPQGKTKARVHTSSLCHGVLAQNCEDLENSEIQTRLTKLLKSIHSMIHSPLLCGIGNPAWLSPPRFELSTGSTHSKTHFSSSEAGHVTLLRPMDAKGLEPTTARSHPSQRKLLFFLPFLPFLWTRTWTRY